MPRVRAQIPNHGPKSLISEVAFSPDGRILGATFMNSNEVCLYDAESLSLIRTFRNPDSLLNEPHGIWLTQRHLIITNIGVHPTEFRIFRLDDDSGTPVQTYTGPFGQLAEGHSLALRGRRLVVTYAERWDKKGAIVSYDYDDECGRIIGPLDIEEQWFRRYGDAKGVCFNETGDAIYVTFISDNLDMSRPRRTLKEFVKNTLSRGHLGRTWRNGIAVFGIDPAGRFTRTPLRTKVFDEYCRLENIQIRGHHAVVTDTMSGRVFCYDLQSDPAFTAPQQVLTDGLVFPHGVCFSPDGRTLVVTDYGIQVVNRKVHWRSFVEPRKDRIVLFDMASA